MTISGAQEHHGIRFVHLSVLQFSFLGQHVRPPHRDRHDCHRGRGLFPGEIGSGVTTLEPG